MSIDRNKIREAIVGDENFEKLDPKLKKIVLKRTVDFAERFILILIGDQKMRRIR